MSSARALEMVAKCTEVGGPLCYEPQLSRLLVRMMRELVKGTPVTRAKVDETMADLGITQESGHRFLGEVAECDADGNVLGIMGLSLNKTAHQISINGTQMSAWCAVDTLFLPAMLGQPARVESVSPVTGEPIRLLVSPQRVEALDPAGMVVSLPIFDPEATDMRSVEALWRALCHHTFFFASREEAERWSAGRDDIEFLSIEDAFELGRLLSSRCLACGD